MQQRKQIPLLLMLMFVSSGVYAAIGDGKAVVLEKPTQVHQTVAKEAQSPPAAKAPEIKTDDTVNVREAGMKACEQAASAAALMSETLAQLNNEILPKVMQTGEEFARQVEPTLRQLEPTMREFADRMREIAQEMGRSLGERSTR
jgi:hypothetical protein